MRRRGPMPQLGRAQKTGTMQQQQMAFGSIGYASVSRLADSRTPPAFGELRDTTGQTRRDRVQLLHNSAKNVCGFVSHNTRETTASSAFGRDTCRRQHFPPALPFKPRAFRARLG